MNLKVITYPDKKLKEVSQPVEVFDEKLHKLLDGMYDVMLASNGVGLAAIQVGKAIEVLVINIPNEDDEEQHIEDLIEIINPTLENLAGSIFYQEGCLSVPGFYEDIERFETVTLHYQNRDGVKHTLHAEGLLSIAIQHEMDHLKGKLFIEKLSYSQRKKFEKEYKKAQKEKNKK
jgi:peptide deformylase